MKEIQETLYTKATNYRDEHISEVNDFESFKEILNSKGGFISAHWDGTAKSEEAIKKATKATIRCIPNTQNPKMACVFFQGTLLNKGFYLLKPTNQCSQTFFFCG